MKNSIGYRIWMWAGSQYRYFRKYNIQRDRSMKKAKLALEKAFTPKLRKMLEDSPFGNMEKLNDDK